MKVELKWISVKDELPKAKIEKVLTGENRSAVVYFSETVWVLTDSAVMTAALVRGEGEEFWACENGECTPLYWFPVPPMPDDWNPANECYNRLNYGEVTYS